MSKLIERLKREVCEFHGFDYDNQPWLTVPEFEFYVESSTEWQAATALSAALEALRAVVKVHEHEDPFDAAHVVEFNSAINRARSARDLIEGNPTPDHSMDGNAR